MELKLGMKKRRSLCSSVVYQYVHPFVYPYICYFVCLSTSSSVHSSPCSSTYLSVCLYIHPFVSPFISPSVLTLRSSVWPSVLSSVHPLVFPSARSFARRHLLLSICVWISSIDDIERGLVQQKKTFFYWQWHWQMRLASKMRKALTEDLLTTKRGEKEKKLFQRSTFFCFLELVFWPDDNFTESVNCY